MKKMTMCKIERHLLKGFYMRSQDKLLLDQIYLNYNKICSFIMKLEMKTIIRSVEFPNSW